MTILIILFISAIKQSLVEIVIFLLIFIVNIVIDFNSIEEIWLDKSGSPAQTLIKIKTKRPIIQAVYGISVLLMMAFIQFVLLNKFVMVLISFAIWLPQIIHNFNLEQPKHLPLLYTFLTSFNRIGLFVYFSSTNKKDNILHTHKDYTVVCLIILSVILQHLIMILQVKYPRKLKHHEISEKRCSPVSDNSNPNIMSELEIEKTSLTYNK